MKIYKLLAVIASMLLVGTLAACGGDDEAGADGRTKIRLAFTPGATTLPVHLAITEGLFEKHGLEVEATEGLDLPTWMAGLDKQWDIAMETPGVYLAGAKQLDLVVLAGGQVTTEGSLAGNPLIVRDPSITEAGDLAGKRVAVATLTGSSPNAVRFVVEQAGEDPDSVELVQVPFESMGDQLKAGQVDAVVSSIPFSLTMLQDPENKALFDVQDTALRALAPDQEAMASIIYTSTRSWADEHPEEAAAFEAALQEAAEWMDDNKDAAIQELSEWLQIPMDVLETLPWPIPIQAHITQAEMQPNLDLLLATGALKEEDAPDLSDRFPNGDD
ncbi:ABC transporter substrate-binding protein [Nocardioides endophyticus]|uniref:ABC transporter substrate-binding protein n=1 Tax=Nocardioides endophyticus TaxID=1353775 RepID=A0ABP8YGY0_9ACTN